MFKSLAVTLKIATNDTRMRYLHLLSAFLFLMCLSHITLAVDLTRFVCEQPQMSETNLTNACKGNPISSTTICQGNEGKAWCRSASLDIGDVSILKASFGFRNRHVFTRRIFNIFRWRYEPFVAYNSNSSGDITLYIDKNCNIIDKKIHLSNETARLVQFLAEVFGKKIERLIPNTVPNCR